MSLDINTFMTSSGSAFITNAHISSTALLDVLILTALPFDVWTQVAINYAGFMTMDDPRIINVEPFAS